MHLTTSTIIRIALWRFADARGIALPDCDKCARTEVMRVARPDVTGTRMWVGLPESWADVIESRWAHLVGVGADVSPISDSQKFGDVARATLGVWAAMTDASRVEAAAAFIAATRRQSVDAA